MADRDRGHIPVEVPDAGSPPPTDARRRLAVLGLILAVVALALAFLPIASFVAGVPALAAIVLAVVVLALGARRPLPAVAVVVSVAALAVAVVVSAQQFAGTVTRFADRVPSFDDPPTGPPPTALPSPTATAGAPGAVGALGAGRHRIRYEVLGDGSARVTYSLFLGVQSGSSSERSVDVPHSRVQRIRVEADGAPARFSMAASRSSASGAPLGCRISIDGRTVVERRPSTALPIAVCAAVAED